MLPSSLCTMLGEACCSVCECVCVESGWCTVISLSVWLLFFFQMMEQLTDHHYEVLTVPEEMAANCIYIKGPSNRDFLLHRPAEECPDSVSVSTADDYVFFIADLSFKMSLILI